MKTLQYIVEAAIYYNPLKMFVLMSCIVIATPWSASSWRWSRS